MLSSCILIFPLSYTNKPPLEVKYLSQLTLLLVDTESPIIGSRAEINGHQITPVAIFYSLCRAVIEDARAKYFCINSYAGTD